MRAKIVSVADLRVVPSALRSKVEPVLRKVEGKDAMILVDSFMTGEGTESAHLSMESYFIPDYTGDILKAVSCADANWTFRLFICLNGKVLSQYKTPHPGRPIVRLARRALIPARRRPHPPTLALARSLVGRYNRR